ncbi:MAG: hypothetical protein JNJ61_15360, partial [Anaerolineae bacterium]|nr:hypothetical protein [Anaerolineae bacterium]
KVDFDALQTAKLAVRDLAARVGIDTDVQADDYPHFFYMGAEKTGWHTLAISGEPAQDFLNTALTSDVPALKQGEQQATWLLEANGQPMSRAILEHTDAEYLLHVEQNAERAAAWLRALSDGFALFDATDPYAKVPGPVDVRALGATDSARLSANLKGAWPAGTGYAVKPYFIGINGAQYAGPQFPALPGFSWQEPASQGLLKTTVNALHREMGAKMVEFAGYDMPVWYSSVTEEHNAVRTGAGVFDVTHMGVLSVDGPGAAAFLDIVTTNEVSKLALGESHYTYLLDAEGIPLDDLMIYRVADESYMMVVNASNNDKVWSYLQAAWRGQIELGGGKRLADQSDRCTLRDLRQGGAERRVDVALQGPKSKDILLGLGGSDADKAKVNKLPWAGVTHVQLGGYDLIVSRTGYTGERTAFELFVHPERAAELFRELVLHGATPCGLAARDSLRTEAGLPLYGHELAGPLNMNPADAGFPTYVKLWKPFFVGKAAYLAHEQTREAQVVRFRLENKGTRPPHQGDPVLDKKGRVVGTVTSCSVDSEGYQSGQAYVLESAGEEGTSVSIFAGAARSKAPKSPGELALGDKLPLPEPAIILSRFPKKK